MRLLLIKIIPAISEVQLYANNPNLYPVELETNFISLISSIIYCIYDCMYHDLVLWFNQKSKNCTWNVATKLEIFIYRDLKLSTTSIPTSTNINEKQYYQFLTYKNSRFTCYTWKRYFGETIFNICKEIISKNTNEFSTIHPLNLITMQR